MLCPWQGSGTDTWCPRARTILAAVYLRRSLGLFCKRMSTLCFVVDVQYLITPYGLFVSARSRSCFFSLFPSRARVLSLSRMFMCTQVLGSFRGLFCFASNWNSPLTGGLTLTVLLASSLFSAALYVSACRLANSAGHRFCFSLLIVCGKEEEEEGHFFVARVMV